MQVIPNLGDAQSAFCPHMESVARMPVHPDEQCGVL